MFEDTNGGNQKKGTQYKGQRKRDKRTDTDGES